ncbi:tyrosine-type recombinase/integrase [Planomonospora corallina]|uniref:Tyrosine-type recombinase/integrase n=1 Tax=Planomonospora corallina TaxID=1806052 RepID=A0ABV8IF89_9ACTN
MAHIDDRWMRRKRGPDGKFMFDAKGKPVLERDPERYGKGKRWRVRYLDPDGNERNKSFAKKVDAERFETEVEADVLRGTYIDPSAGKVTFQKLAEDVFEHRTLDPKTRDAMRRRMANHVYPVIGSVEIGRLAQRPSMIQQLVKTLEDKLTPNYIQVLMSHVGLVFSVAIDDNLITKNPTKASTVVLPKATKKKLVPWTAEQVRDMTSVLPPPYQAMVPVGAGLGLRQGEIFGLSPDDIDWERGVVHVKRQVKSVKGPDGKWQLLFAPPKGRKLREIPLASSVQAILSEQLDRFPPMEVTLPWRATDGEPTTVRLFFSEPDRIYGGALDAHFANRMWHKGLQAAGIPRMRENGMHALRHRFASTLLTDGESIQAVSEWLGHHSAAFTLTTYVHLMPSSEQRMRRIIDAALGPASGPDGPQTAQTSNDHALAQVR